MLYGDALQEIVDQLIVAGIPSTTEPSEVALPGALIYPGPLTFEFLDGDTYSAEVDVYLVTNQRNSIPALNDLQELLTKFRTAFDALEATPVSLELRNAAGPDPVPALLLTLQLTITKD